VSWHPCYFSWLLRYREPGLEALAQRAEQKQDAEALVFVAVRDWDASEGARLAQEAVRLDPNLVWVYGIVYICPTKPSERDQRIQKLEQWDPQNALPCFIIAECLDIDEVVREKIPKRVEDETPAWRNALAAAFQSPKLDGYQGRLKELDRRVLVRYGIENPYHALVCENPWCSLPTLPGIPLVTRIFSSNPATCLRPGATAKALPHPNLAVLFRAFS